MPRVIAQDFPTLFPYPGDLCIPVQPYHSDIVSTSTPRLGDSPGYGQISGETLLSRPLVAQMSKIPACAPEPKAWE